MPDFDQSSEHVAGLQPHHEPLGPQALAHTVSTCVTRQGSQELTEFPCSHPAQSRSLVWGPSHTGDEPLIWGFLSGSHGQVLPAAGTCSESAQFLGRDELRPFGVDWDVTS